jgi:F0F1-type ATP synthase assembly protein I
MGGRRKNNPRYDKSVYRAIVLVTQFGINMLVPICMMSALGIWLDGRYHTSFWTILLFFVGAIAGAQNIYRMARKIYEADDEKEQGTVHEDSKDAEKSK